MKYITTHTTIIDEYNTVSVSTAPFSKLLKVVAVNGQLELVFESTEMGNNGSNLNKTFYLKILKNIQQNDTYIDDRFEFFDTIRIQEGDYIDYYHIFVDEVKPLVEVRDDKINEIIDEEF